MFPISGTPALVTVLFVSVGAQLLAALMAVRLVRVTGWRLSWAALAAALFLMAVRRSLTLYHLLAEDGASRVDPAAETVALVISLLLLAGLTSVVLRFASVRRGERALRESEERYRRMVDAAGDGVWLLDSKGRTIYANPRMGALLGLEAHELVGRFLFEFVDSRSRSEAERNFKRHRLGVQEQYDLCLRAAGGQALWTIFSANMLTNDRGEFIGALAVVTDITARKGGEHAALRSNQYDPLTGLPNRTLLMDRLNQALAFGRRHHRQVSVLFVDLDRFKPINDRFGHEAGDAVLREVADRMASRLRKTDTVARYGGDEFIAILQDLKDEHEAVGVAEIFLELLQQPIEVDGDTFHVGASVGISIYPLDGQGSEELIRRADEAMYRAKRSGGNTFCLFRSLPAEDS